MPIKRLKLSTPEQNQIDPYNQLIKKLKTSNLNTSFIEIINEILEFSNNFDKKFNDVEDNEEEILK